MSGRKGQQEVYIGISLARQARIKEGFVPRSLWKGSLAFGLVNIPVELHTAVREHRLHFRMLHATDKSPVKFTRVCIRDGKPVAWQDLVKGFEYEKGRYVVLTQQDFESAAVERNSRIDVLDFVDGQEIDDRFRQAVHLAPAKGGEHAHALLRSDAQSGTDWRRQVHPATHSIWRPSSHQHARCIDNNYASAGRSERLSLPRQGRPQERARDGEDAGQSPLPTGTANTMSRDNLRIVDARIKGRRSIWGAGGAAAGRSRGPDGALAAEPG